MKLVVATPRAETRKELVRLDVDKTKVRSLADFTPSMLMSFLSNASSALQRLEKTITEHCFNYVPVAADRKPGKVSGSDAEDPTPRWVIHDGTNPKLIIYEQGT
jgi:hypothetical protein